MGSRYALWYAAAEEYSATTSLLYAVPLRVRHTLIVAAIVIVVIVPRARRLRSFADAIG